MKRFLLLLAVAAAAGCQKDPAAPVPLRLAKDIIVVVGDSQAGVVHAQLPAPVVVRVLDDAQRPIHGQLVNFVVTAGGGHVFAGSSLTDTSGEARELWTLGDTAGIQRMAARAVDPTTGAAITFAEIVAIARPGPLAHAGFSTLLLRVFGGVRTALPAVAVDAYGNAVAVPALAALDSLAPDSALGVTPRSPGLFRFVLSSDTLCLLVYVPGGVLRAVTRRGDTTWTETGTLAFRSFDQFMAGTVVHTAASYMLTGLIAARQVGAAKSDSVIAGPPSTPAVQEEAFPYVTGSNKTILFWGYRWPGVSMPSAGLTFVGGGWVFTGDTVDSLTVTP